MKLLYLTVGLPGSGKSTWARATGHPIVCPDSIRLALHGERWIALAEPFVWAIAKVMVRALFLAGHDIVVLDATGTTRMRRDQWKDAGWQRHFILFPASAEVCIARARARDGNDYIVPIIEKMAAEFEEIAEDEKDE